MSFKTLYSLLVVFLPAASVTGQSISYSYDTNGNRTARTLTVEELRSNSVSFPVTDPATLPGKFLNSTSKGQEPAKEADIETHKEDITLLSEGEIRVLIYPNPTKGILKIAINHMIQESENEMRLYDLSGAELIIVRDFADYAEMDISRFRDGIYILRIRIGEKLFDFKVIKNQ